MTTKKLNNACGHCTYNNTDSTEVCNICNRNPLITDKFKSTDVFYPLEIQSTHINLWAEDGKYKWTIALFEYSSNEEVWDLKYIGKRPLDPRVDWNKLKELTQIGYDALEGTKM